MNRFSHATMLFVGLLAGIALVAGGLFAISTTNRTAFGQAPDAVAEPNAPLAISQVLSYQGRLIDPSTGAPKNDGVYEMTFSIYNVLTGGTPLWTETKSVTVGNGAFTSLLGDTTPLVQGNFNGQELFLGIKVGDDAEATPRQRLAHTAYAMFAENAAKLGGQGAAAFAATDHTHTGAQIVDESIADADIKDTTRIIGFPANALNYEPGGIIIANATGLRWQSSFSKPAYLNIPRPFDWDGTSDVDLVLYFMTTSGTAGNVQFFIRPRAYDPGDTFADAASIAATPLAVAQNSLITRQTIIIPASRFGTKRLWVIAIQRDGSQETYNDDLILTSVGLSYTATR